MAGKAWLSEHEAAIPSSQEAEMDAGAPLSSPFYSAWEPSHGVLLASFRVGPPPLLMTS